MLPGIQADDVEGELEHLKGGLHLDLPQGVEQGCGAGNHLAGDQAREDGEHSFVFAAGKFSELSSKGFPQSNLLLDIWHGGVLVVGVDGGDLDVQVKDVFGKVVQLLWKIALETDRVEFCDGKV